MLREFFGTMLSFLNFLIQLWYFIISYALALALALALAAGVALIIILMER
jgi:uncharacterized membrane protein (GlpM family)